MGPDAKLPDLGPLQIDVHPDAAAGFVGCGAQGPVRLQVTVLRVP
jgi:hypothetical protein